MEAGSAQGGCPQGGCPQNRGQSLGSLLCPLAGQTELPTRPGLAGAQAQAQAQAKQTLPQLP